MKVHTQIKHMNLKRRGSKKNFPKKIEFDSNESIDESKTHQLCESCGEIIKAADHYCKQTEIEESIELCESCGEVFNTKQSLDEHMKLHHNKTDKKHEEMEVTNQLCEACGQVFDSVPDLENHMNVEHTTKDKSKVRKKVNTKVFDPESNPRRFPCKVCNRNFKSAAAEYYHRKAVHDKVKYPCISCNMVFKSKTGLKHHNQVIHEKVRYSCTACSKIFLKKRSLAKHHCF